MLSVSGKLNMGISHNFAGDVAMRNLSACVAALVSLAVGSYLYSYTFYPRYHWNVELAALGWVLMAVGIGVAAWRALRNYDGPDFVRLAWMRWHRKRHLHLRYARRRRAFTMVELLIVVVIIGILIALLLPALQSAVRRTYEAQVSVEIESFTQALEAFKNEYGSYPPSRIILCEDGDYSPARFPANLQAVRQRTLDYMRKFFPRAPLRTDGGKAWTILAKPTSQTDPKSNFYDFNGNDQPDSGYIVLQGHQCLVFFLGGIPAYNNTGTLSLEGFGKNPSNPFVASKDNSAADPTWNKFAQSIRNNPFYRFDSNRLVIDGNYPGYIDSLDTVNDKRFFAYFCSYNGIYDLDDCNFVETDDNNNPLIGGFEFLGKTFSSPSPNPYTEGMPLAVNTSGNLDTNTNYSCRFLRRDSYQLFGAGSDRKYGIGGYYTQRGDDRLPFAAPANQTVTGIALPPNTRDCERDNITNFATGKLD